MKNQKKALRLGLFIIAAVVLFVVTVYLIGSKGNIFSSTTNIRASFKDIRGLIVGNNVRFAGINVGTVKDIEIMSDTAVIVTLSVKDNYIKYIYKNSTVQIGQEGVMGGKIVLISTGDPATGQVENNDLLPITEGPDIQGMIAQAQDVLRDAGGAIANLRSVTKKIDEGDGDISRLINQNTITTHLNTAAGQINASLGSVNEIINKVNSGKGDLGKLINEDNVTKEMQSILTNLNAVSQTADSVMNQIHATSYALNHGEGALPRLLHDKQMGQNIDTAVAKVDQGVVEVTRAAETISNSWIFRLFSKKKKKDKVEASEKTENPLSRVQKGDTIVIRVLED